MAGKRLKHIIVTLSLFIICCLLFTVTGCQKKQEVKKQNEAIPVKVMRVELKDIQKTLDYVGDIEAQDSAQIYPRVSGKVIEKLKEDGSTVIKNETIAYIDRDEIGLTFEKAPVDSPLTGIIGRVYVDKGSTVTAQTVIALVIDIEKVKINLDIPEKYLPKVSIGQPAKINVDAYPEKEFTGIVSKISPVVDKDTRTTPIEIVILNEQHFLKPGMFARVQLLIEEHKNVPLILKEAILGNYVYVVSANDNIAHKKSIIQGIQKGADVEIIEGLKEGDLVVIMGQQRLHNGASVLIKE